MTNRFACEICGHLRSGAAHICTYCHSAVCDRCWTSQARKGHLDAEHRHEMARDTGTYSTGYDDGDYDA